MSDTPTPRLVDLLEQWEYSPTVSALIELADQLERELTEARRELENLNQKLTESMERGVASDFARLDLERQLTAHKEVLNLCQMSLCADMHELFVELRHEALATIAKLKEGK